MSPVEVQWVSFIGGSLDGQRRLIRLFDGEAPHTYHVFVPYEQAWELEIDDGGEMLYRLMSVDGEA